jgi:hypothetical protein
VGCCSAPCRDGVLVVVEGARVVDGAVVMHLTPLSGRLTVGEHADGADLQGDDAAAGVVNWPVSRPAKTAMPAAW